MDFELDSVTIYRFRTAVICRCELHCSMHDAILCNYVLLRAGYSYIHSAVYDIR